MYQDALEDSFEEDLVKGVVLLAKEMGWTIDYVLDMGITRFHEVSKVIKEYYDEQNRQMELGKMRSTFGGI